MKDIIIKHTKILTSLDDLSDIDNVIKANIKRCLAIYVNGEILRAFNRYVTQPGVVVTADMITFFYLHLQMSGAANESLNRSFTDSCPRLGKVLFDDTADGKGAARLPRFAGAHSTSLSALLQGFSPKLLIDYITAIEAILPVIEKSILRYAPSLESTLCKKEKISFSPMAAIDFSSSKFIVSAQQSEAGWLLESMKAMDILAPILNDEQQSGFCESASGQALAIMARQVVANNIFELIKSGTLSPSPDFAKLRQFRNCSAHGFVMWEIQNNPVQLRFNCTQYVLGTRDILVAKLANISPAAYTNYLNPPNLETKVREEENSISVPYEEPTKVKKKKQKPAKVKVLPEQEAVNREFQDKQALQTRGTRDLIAYMLGLMDISVQATDLMTKLKEIAGALDDLNRINPGFLIHDINDPLVGRAKGRINKFVNSIPELKCSGIRNKLERHGYLSCPIEVFLSPGSFYNMDYVVSELAYPKGIKEIKFYLLGLLFSIFSCEVKLLDDPYNLAFFTNVLQKFLDYGASPNVMLQTGIGEGDILSFAVANDFPIEVITLLLERGANIHHVVGNRSCVNSLTFAARSRPDVMVLLLQAGANPLEIVYDPFNIPVSKSSLFYDLISTMSSPIELRLASLGILYPYIFQKYGEEALLTNMQTSMKIFAGGRKIKEIPMREFLAIALTFPTLEQKRSHPQNVTGSFTREDIMPAYTLHQNVQTVLTDPRYSFYKLVLHDEVGIIRQEIAKLGSSQAVLAAMGINNGHSFTALDFALELGLTKIHWHLKQEQDRCLGIKPVAPAIENKVAPLAVAPVPTSHVASSCCATSLSYQHTNRLGINSNLAILVGVVAVACTAMLYLANCIEKSLSR